MNFVTKLIHVHYDQVYMYETNPNTRINLLVDNAKLSSDLAVKSLPKVSQLQFQFSNQFQIDIEFKLIYLLIELKALPKVSLLNQDESRSLNVCMLGVQSEHSCGWRQVPGEGI